MKDKIIYIFKIILKFILAYIILFFIGFSIINALSEFDIVDLYNSSYWVLVASLLGSIVWLIINELQHKSIYVTKFKAFISTYSMHIMWIIIVIIICLNTVEKECKFDFDALQSILNLAWTIFGIIIAVYLVYKVVVPEYLKKKQPEEINDKSLISKHINLKKKSLFISFSNIYLSIEIVFFITLIFLCFATYLIYQNIDMMDVVTQNCTRIALNLCVLLVVQFLFILFLSDESRQEVLKKNKITDSDYKDEKALKDKIDKLLPVIAEETVKIQNLEGVNAENKNIMIKEMVSKLCEREFVISSSDDKKSIDR